MVENEFAYACYVGDIAREQVLSSLWLISVAYWLSGPESDLPVPSVRTAIRLSAMLSLLTTKVRYTVIVTRAIQGRLALAKIGNCFDRKYRPG